MMGGFVYQYLVAEKRAVGLKAQIGLLLGTEERIAGEEDQTRPALAQIARHLRKRKRAKRIRSEPLGKTSHRMRRPVGHGLGVACG